MENLPIVTIVTVCYNAAALIESTILSVLGQTYKHIEYIIIDGGSTDGTVEIIHKYESRLSYWISEKDNGIYDAMNKGIAVAKGHWINFMNAGDLFCDERVIEKVFSSPIPANVRVLYGDTIALLSNNRQVPIKALPLARIKRGMVFCHQSVFVSLVNKDDVYFEIKYRLAADYNQLYTIYTKYGSMSFHHRNLPISFYEFENGYSARYKISCLKERFQIHLDFGLWISCFTDLLMILLSKLGIK